MVWWVDKLRQSYLSVNVFFALEPVLSFIPMESKEYPGIAGGWAGSDHPQMTGCSPLRPRNALCRLALICQNGGWRASGPALNAWVLPAKGSRRLFAFGQRVSIPDKDRVADWRAGTEFYL